MGLETILFHAAGAGAMVATAPTTAVIRPGSGDAYIVGVILLGVTATSVTLTCGADPRWDPVGARFQCSGDGGVQDTSGFEYGSTDVRIPIGRGLTLAAAQLGAGDADCYVYIEYPNLGEAYSPRNPYVVAPTNQMTWRNGVAGAALVAHVVTLNSVAGGIIDWIKGRKYELVNMKLLAVMVGPEIAVGFTDPHTSLITFWPLCLNPTLSAGQSRVILPHGALTKMEFGDVLNVHFVSANADTPTVTFGFAHNAP